MTPDGELLRRYAAARSEEAFAELVRRHLDLVHSAALRQVNGDLHLAQDVAQIVFTDLARKAGSLSGRAALTGWLYTSTRFAAIKAARTEGRRRAREHQAQTMRELLHDPGTDPDWETLRLTLDEAMHELREGDREVILLRYFEDRQLAKIGERLGVSENAARMRVERAIEKLHGVLARRGLTTTAALSAVLCANAVQSAPAGLAATLTSASLAGAVAGGATLSTLRFMATTKLKLGIAALVIAGTVTTLVIQHRAEAQLRAENAALRREMAQLKSDNDEMARQLAQAKRVKNPRLPAPALQTALAPADTQTDLQGTNLYDRFKGEEHKLTAAQLEAYLKANHRNVSSLLAAYRTSHDPAFLAEAMQKFPNDPHVAFEAVFDKDLSPEDQRQWLNTFEKSDPDNALPNYLSALNYFKSGQTDQAVQELIAASGKTQFQDYSVDRYQDDAEAYLGAGYSVAEAKTEAALQLLLPQLAQVKQLGLDLADMAKSYQQAGDADSAQSALQMTMNLGERYADQSPGEAMISQLVGLAVEKIALSGMDPNSLYGPGGQTVQDALNQIAQKRDDLHAMGQQVEAILPTLSDEDWVNYKDRWMTSGETAAEQWLVGKYGTK
jgi:RNA polymerase sigma factor (sigma-70 family)